MPRKSQFTEQQINRALQEVDTGTRAAEVCRRLGVAEATFYRWKSKYAGMDVSDAKRLKELEAEDTRLKKLVAEQAGPRSGSVGASKKMVKRRSRS